MKRDQYLVMVIISRISQRSIPHDGPYFGGNKYDYGSGWRLRLHFLENEAEQKTPPPPTRSGPWCVRSPIFAARLEDDQASNLFPDTPHPHHVFSCNVSITFLHVKYVFFNKILTYRGLCRPPHFIAVKTFPGLTFWALNQPEPTWINLRQQQAEKSVPTWTYLK